MVVITYNGAEEKREDCVFIRGKYFHKERDCFFYEGKYYSPFSRYMILDNETGEKVHKLSRRMNYGIIGLKNDVPILGYYSDNIAKNGSILFTPSMGKENYEKIIEAIDDATADMVLSDQEMPERHRRRPLATRLDEDSSEDVSTRTNQSSLVKCMDVFPFLNSGMISSVNSDCILNPKDKQLYRNYFNRKYDVISAEVPYNFGLSYNSEAMMDDFKKSFDKNSYPLTDKINNLSKYLGNHTYGIEYESWNGRVPTYIAAQNGLIPLRDGSLRHDGICGYEYATVIMQGAKGLAAIKSQCEELRKHTTFNENCSMHIHVGNIPKTKEALINLYKGLYKIQASMYSMFPSCLMNTQQYKQKAYCSPLPKLNYNEDSIIAWLSDGIEEYHKFGKSHPKDPRSDRKWEIHSRYSIFNLNNYYYTNRGTIELRVSTPTFNHNKVSALLIIFCLIIDNALNGKFYDSVEQLVRENTSGEEMEWLTKYIKHRISSLSGWNSRGNGVEYFENISNDKETGCNNELY